MDVSIIIVNYHTSLLIADCLNSVFNFSRGIDYEVIIIDNNSEKNFKEIILSKIPESAYKSIHFISLPENIGFGRANNEALKISTGRNIFFLNPDTVLLNNAIKILSDFLDSHTEAGACGGNLFDENLKPTYSYKRFLPGIFWEADELMNSIPQKIRFKQNRYFNSSNKPLEVKYVTGADLMIKREVLETTMGFRPEYFLYYEETDLCYRIIKSGWKIYSVPQAKIQHLESRSFDTSEEYQSDFKTENLEKSRNIYYQLNKGNFEKSLGDTIYYLFLTSRIKLIKNRRKKDYYKRRLKYFKEKINC